MSAARYALDANVLVYRFDEAAPAKRGRAVELIDALGGRDAVVPVQALAETARVLLVKRRPPLTPDEVAGYVRRLAAAFTPVPLTAGVVAEAVRGAGAHGLSYFDAQIWAAAREAGATVVLSEDFQDGRVVEGVRFANPFAPAFNPAAL